MEIIQGDLLNNNYQYIVHQCNCVSKDAAYLAKSIFTKFPYSDIYLRRQRIVWNGINSLPEKERGGNIIIKGNGNDERFIIAILGQIFPGFPKFPTSNIDGYIAREKYFQTGLEEISKIKNLKSIAFPYKIGCGAAGGNWNNYLKMIKDFSNNNPEVKIAILKLIEEKNE